MLAKKYTSGHPGFYKLLEEEAKLHNDKNHDYAIGGNPLGNFHRVAEILSHYPNLDLSKSSVVALVYMMKQIDANLWMASQGHKPKVEGSKSRWMDVSVYAKIIILLIQEERCKSKNVKS